MKQKYGKRKHDDTVDDPITQKDIWGVANFLPERIPGEDHTTISAYITKIKHQKNLTLGKRNTDVIKLSMDKTFPERRNELIVEFKKIIDILSLYPLLTEGEQILQEFKRVSGFDIREKFYPALKSNSQTLLRMQSKAVLVKTGHMMVKIAEPQTEQRKEYCTISTSLISAMLMLRELPQALMDSSSSAPVIVTSRELMDLKDLLDDDMSFKVLVEGNAMSDSSDFIFSFMVMFASYYTFNLVYNQKLYGTLSFIQKCILNIGDGSKTRPKVLSLIAKMKHS